MPRLIPPFLVGDIQISWDTHWRERGLPLFLTLNLIINHTLSPPSPPGPTPTTTSLPTISTLLGVSRNPEHPNTVKALSVAAMFGQSSGQKYRASQHIRGNEASLLGSQDLGQVARNTRK